MESFLSAMSASNIINQLLARTITIHSFARIIARKALNQIILIAMCSTLSMNVSDAIKDSTWIQRESAGNEIHTEIVKNIILHKINVKNASTGISLRR